MTNRIAKLYAEFLMGGLGDEPKFHLVKWATMVLVYGKLLAGDGLLCLIIFCMKLVMGRGSSLFWRDCSVGRLLLLAILNYLEFAKIRRQVWLSF